MASRVTKRKVARTESRVDFRFPENLHSLESLCISQNRQFDLKINPTSKGRILQSFIEIKSLLGLTEWIKECVLEWTLQTSLWRHCSRPYSFSMEELSFQQHLPSLWLTGLVAFCVYKMLVVPSWEMCPEERRRGTHSFSWGSWWFQNQVGSSPVWMETMTCTESSFSLHISVCLSCHQVRDELIKQWCSLNFKLTPVCSVFGHQQPLFYIFIKKYMESRAPCCTQLLGWKKSLVLIWLF